jgi:hypothetical protein
MFVYEEKRKLQQTIEKSKCTTQEGRWLVGSLFNDASSANEGSVQHEYVNQGKAYLHL